MSELKATPGPWSVERIDYDKYGMDASFEVSAGFRTVVQTHMREIKNEGEWLATDEANCRLIAAAPALYAVSERLCELMGEAGVFGMESNCYGQWPTAKPWGV